MKSANSTLSLSQQTMAAEVLFALTGRTFDRCLDRMPESGSCIHTRRKESRKRGGTIIAMNW
jgi:hypothetical protein